MASIQSALDAVKDDGLALIKGELKALLTEARDDAEPIVRETGEKVATWLVMRGRGELNDDELQSLLYARDQLLRQVKIKAEIDARARLERIAVGLVNLVLDKLVGIAF